MWEFQRVKDKLGYNLSFTLFCYYIFRENKSKIDFWILISFFGTKISKKK